MCLSIIAIDCHRKYHLIWVFQREEFYSRETGVASANIFPDNNEMIGGIDLVKPPGTWFAICPKSGRIGALTNIRTSFDSIRKDAKGRGHIIVDYLSSSSSSSSSSEVVKPVDYLVEVTRNVKDYNPYNLIVGSFDDGFYYVSSDEVKKKLHPQSNSNNDNGNGNGNGNDKYDERMTFNLTEQEEIVKKSVIKLQSGSIHALANASLDTDWFRVRRVKEKFTDLLASHEIISLDDIFAIMNDKEKPEITPKTGLSSEEWERELAPVFVNYQKQQYGSRSCSILMVDNEWNGIFCERSLDFSTINSSTQAFSYQTFKFPWYHERDSYQ